MEQRHMFEDQQQLIIFLQVHGGIHFQQDKQGRKIALSASLNQQVLEAISQRPVTPGSGTASFNSKLVWACNRVDLKDMKTKNAPIKLECYVVEPGGNRNPIGSVVIPLRSVPVVPLSRTKTIKPRWYRLIGIENARWRREKPELHLLVMVTDEQYLSKSNCQEGTSTPDMSGDEVVTEPAQPTTVYPIPAPDQLPSNVELLTNRGLLQIGCKDSDTDLYLFELVFKCAQHLDVLCPGIDSFRLRYLLFGDYHMSVAERKEQGSAVFNIMEKIVMNVRSSALALADYFQNVFQIVVELLPDDDPASTFISTGGVIGGAVIDLVDFVKPNRLADNNPTLEAIRNVPISVRGKKALQAQDEDKMDEKLIVPSLKCKFSLRYLGSDQPIPSVGENERKLIEPETCNAVVQPDMVTSKTVLAKEDFLESDAKKSKTTSSIQPAEAKGTKQREHVDVDEILLATEQDLRDIRHTFAFRVGVGTVKFTSSPSSGLWQLALQHPKADTPFTKVTLELLPDVAVYEDRIEFGNLTLELLFSALPDRVVETIGSEPSKLTINGPHGFHALARLDNENLLIGTRERQPSGVVVMVNESTENVAIASIGCALQEVGLNYNSQLAVLEVGNCNHHSGHPQQHPPKVSAPFDETIAYQLVEEQKVWMREQRKQFLEQLKDKERKHLQAMSHNWKMRRAEAEKRLVERLTHNQALAAALEEARRTLEKRAPDESSKVAQLEQQYRAQLETIRTKALRLEQEAEEQIALTRRQCRELQQQLAELSLDQQHLIEANRQLRIELDQERTDRMQESEAYRKQLHEVTESKQHYKEQWAKLTRKVHQLEQGLSVTRSPYYMPGKKESRTGRRTEMGGSGSQMSVPHNPRQGAGDCCVACDCPLEPSSTEYPLE
ncbi:centrosomal protein of 120 kDa-like [Anopheles nili]|uniref:centrosomal protein of 120 kDa-like n=1 Tax=Anopheles nili TaxID=185578 RepID=UPI00237C4036|nr:centrosomal protein of 120 kDa-like [Anopheles nili]